MRRNDKLITDQSVLNEILYQSQVIRVAFANKNMPYIVPLSYGYHDNKIFIHSATKGLKIDLIRQNPEVCFEIEYHSEIVKDEIACNWTTRYRSIIGYGTISIVTDDQSKTNGLDIIMKKYGGESKNEYNEKQLGNMVLLIIKVNHYTGKQSGEW